MQDIPNWRVANERTNAEIWWNFDCSKLSKDKAPEATQQQQQQQGGSWLGRMFTDKAGDAKSVRNPNLECDIQKSGFQPNTTDFNRPSAEEVAQMKAQQKASSVDGGGDASQRRRIRWESERGWSGCRAVLTSSTTSCVTHYRASFSVDWLIEFYYVLSLSVAITPY